MFGFEIPRKNCLAFGVFESIKIPKNLKMIFLLMLMEQKIENVQSDFSGNFFQVINETASAKPHNLPIHMHFFCSPCERFAKQVFMITGVD